MFPPLPPPKPRPDRPDSLDTFLAAVLAFAIAVAAWVVVSIIFGLTNPPDPFTDPDDPLDSTHSASQLAPTGHTEV